MHKNKHFLNPHFYMSKEAPCPYLPGRTERLFFTRLPTHKPDDLHSLATKMGFRRSRDMIYAPACVDCMACKSSRIIVDGFTPHKSFKRILHKNKDVHVEHVSPVSTDEQFYLLRLYLEKRHNNGTMMDMDRQDFARMVDHSMVDTQITEYRDGQGCLIACALADRVMDGFSLVYSFFDPQEDKRSLGSFMILDYIDYARACGLDYVYLGYWVAQSKKMGYKKRFQPLQIFDRENWVMYNNERDYGTQKDRD